MQVVPVAIDCIHLRQGIWVLAWEKWVEVSAPYIADKMRECRIKNKKLVCHILSRFQDFDIKKIKRVWKIDKVEEVRYMFEVPQLAQWHCENVVAGIVTTLWHGRKGELWWRQFLMLWQRWYTTLLNRCRNVATLVLQR